MSEGHEGLYTEAAKILHAEMFSGCVQWEDDPTDTCTSGSPADRRRALDFARAALAPAVRLMDGPSGLREQLEAARKGEQIEHRMRAAAEARVEQLEEERNRWKAAAEEGLDALRETRAVLEAIGDGDVPGTGDWGDCVMAFARAALNTEGAE